MKINQAILATLRYSDHFSFPLTHTEIYERLIEVKVTPAQVASTLTELIEQKKVVRVDDFFCLKGRTQLVRRRLERASASQRFLVRARILAAQLIRVPGVKAIYLTGSLAMMNADRDADIDLMIITEPGRLWTTRLLMTIYTELRGLRRRAPAKSKTKWGRPAAGKLCLNLYLTPRSYALPADKQSLYTAYELIQAVPLYDPHNTRSALLTANSWIKDFLPNVTLSEPIVSRENGKTGLLEYIAYSLQLAYMHRKITSESIGPEFAFFHPHNPGVAVLKKIALLK